MTVGRDPECSIRADFHGVSRVHARLERDRGGQRLRGVDLESRNGVQVNGWKVPDRGADCTPGSVIRVGEAIYVYRLLDEDEAHAAALPPLPGPVNSRHGPLVRAIQRVQKLCSAGGPIWLCGPSGCGRSVLEHHLRALAGERAPAAWITGAALNFKHAESVPDDAIEARTVEMPSLRNRQEDLMVLVGSLCGRRQPRMTPRLIEALHIYDWPGNIRELRIALERAFHPAWGAMPGGAWDVDVFPDIQEYLSLRPRPARNLIESGVLLPETGGDELRESISAQTLRETLEEHRWQLFPSARALGLRRDTLVDALSRVGIRGPAQGYPGDGTHLKAGPSTT